MKEERDSEKEGILIIVNISRHDYLYDLVTSEYSCKGK